MITNLPAGIHTFLVQAMSPTGGTATDSRLWNVSCSAPQGDASSFGLFHMDEGTGVTLANAHPFQPPPPSRDGRLGDENNPGYEPDRITPGRFGSGAIRFAGHAVYETDRIFAPALLEPPAGDNVGEHSIEMWVNPTPSFAHDLYLFSVYSSEPAGHLSYWIKFVRNGTKGYFRLETRGNGIDRNINSQMVDIGVYHYVVFSYVPNTQPMLFVDGVATRVPESVSGTFTFFFDGFSRYEGDLDELHLTFHAFTEDELLARWCPP